MASSPLFFFLLFLSVVSAVKLPLSPFTHHADKLPNDPYISLRRLADSSIARAKKIKQATTIKPDEEALSAASTTTASATVVKSPLSARSFGGYSVSLSFGTPSQTIPFVFDTGSSLVWFPCTSKYLCSDCNFSGVDPTRITRFVPKNSTSSQLIGCQNPKCQFLFGPNVQCRGCDPNTRNCTVACPPYVIQYGLGTTAGLLLSETLDFPDLSVPNFVVGCSIISNRQPAGIAGFGRGSESLPSQMKLTRFSHCLVSRRFDDTNVSSDLDLDTGSGHKSGSKTPGLSYTPFRNNPNVSNSAYLEYYYLNLRRIYVGSKHVKIPFKFLAPGTDGNGGTIVDSGSTFTFMDRPAFDLVAEEFATQMSNYSRDKDLEKLTGLEPCFNISGEDSVIVPELVFEFKGGAKMQLPSSNYFSFVGSADNICLTVVADSTVGPSGGGKSGPAIILGSFQQQNYHVEYDLENDRFGFAKKKCSP